MSGLVWNTKDDALAARMRGADYVEVHTVGKAMAFAGTHWRRVIVREGALLKDRDPLRIWAPRWFLDVYYALPESFGFHERNVALVGMLLEKKHDVCAARRSGVALLAARRKQKRLPTFRSERNLP